MAQELQFYGDPAADSGLTITARVYDASGAQVGTDIATTEAGTSAIYIADMPAAAAGVYGVRFFDGDELLGSGFLPWDGAAEVDEVTLSARLSTIEADTDELKQNQSDWATATGFSTLSAADVWQYATRDLTSPVDVSDLEAKVQEIAQIHGLDPANPLIKTPTTVTVGGITQTLSGDGVNSATLTRTA